MCVICFRGGLRVFRKSWGVKIKLVGEAFNVVGDVRVGKGELGKLWGTQKIHGGVTSWGLLQRSVLYDQLRSHVI